jgi:hypothetical protein
MPLATLAVIKPNPAAFAHAVRDAAHGAVAASGAPRQVFA